MPQAHTQSWNIAEPEIMQIPSRLDSDTALQIEEDVQLCIQSGAREMVLDCAELVYLTGAGVRCLLHLARAMQDVDGKLALCKLQSQPQSMIEACGLANIIPIYDNPVLARLALVA